MRETGRDVNVTTLGVYREIIPPKYFSNSPSLDEWEVSSKEVVQAMLTRAHDVYE